MLEPPTRLEFSNSTGGWLDCTTSGSPPPSVTWVTGDGARVGEVGAVRRVHPNGTLVLLPFPAAAYRQDVHSATYRCIAANAVGAVTSREVLVRAGQCLLPPRLLSPQERQRVAVREGLCCVFTSPSSRSARPLALFPPVKNFPVNVEPISSLPTKSQ